MIEKAKFNSFEVNSDYVKEDIISVRLNKEERAWLEEIKEDLNIRSDGKALKLSSFIGKNVVQAMFTRKILTYLFSDQRVKLNEIEDTKEKTQK